MTRRVFVFTSFVVRVEIRYMRNFHIKCIHREDWEKSDVVRYTRYILVDLVGISFESSQHVEFESTTKKTPSEFPSILLLTLMRSPNYTIWASIPIKIIIKNRSGLYILKIVFICIYFFFSCFNWSDIGENMSIKYFNNNKIYSYNTTNLLFIQI